MSIKQFDRQNIRRLRADLSEAFEEIGKTHGIQIKLNGSKWSNNEGTIKVVVNTLDGSGVAETKERKAFKMLAAANGLDPLWLDQTFTSNGETYTITGYNVRAPQYPVQGIRVSDGTRFKFPVITVAQCMKR